MLLVIGSPAMGEVRTILAVTALLSPWPDLSPELVSQNLGLITELPKSSLTCSVPPATWLSPGAAGARACVPKQLEATPSSACSFLS